MPSNPSPTRAKAPLRRLHPTTQGNSPYGVFGSLLFHGLIVAAMLFGFTRDFSTPQESHVVPVDLVTIADETNVAAQAPPAPEPEKMDMPQPVVEAPPEPQMEAVEPAPEPPIPKFDIKKPEPPKPDKPVEKPKKNASDDFASLLNKLTAPEKPVKNARPADRVIQGAGAGTAMTANIADALKSQIYRCWSPPTGAPNARDLVVDFDLRLNRDGSVGGVQMTGGTAMAAASSPYTRAAAEAASRAIYACQPYRLPPERYNVWQEISPLRFDPRQMMEQ
jgi:outer membrane biosynthesis protein TonB